MDFPLPIHTFRLDNGLSVVVQPDPASPTVAVALTYRVGSQNERPGRSGFAHLFEHLMAQGTRNLRPRELSAIIEGNGGVRNASTMKTNTNYYCLVPKNVLETALWAEADRMHALHIDARALALEQQVVLEEMRLRYLNQPYRLAQTRGMGEAAFTKWENRHPTIGEMEDIRRADLEDVRGFYRSHYAPNNAALALAGDVTIERARELVLRYFGPVHARDISPEPDLSEPPLRDRTFVELADPMAKLPRLMAGWRIPERGARDFWALSLLMDLLSGKEENPLYRALVKEAKLALSADGIFPWWTDHVTLRGPDLCGFDLLLKPGVRAREALEALDGFLTLLERRGPSEEDLARVKAQAEYHWFNGMQSLLDRARVLSYYAALIGPPEDLPKDLERLRSVTAEDARGALGRWLLERGRAAVSVVPGTPSAPVREEEAPRIPEEGPRPPGEPPPRIGPAHAPPIPSLDRFTLSNGLSVLLCRDARLPLMEARLSLEAGEASEAPGEEGLSDGTAALLLKGTVERDSASLARFVSGLGFSLDAAGRKETVLLYASGLARNARKFFPLLGEVLRGAVYPEEELSLWKESVADKLRALRFDPEFLTQERLKQELFPGHPYGKPFLDERVLAAIRRDGLSGFHRRRLSPRAAHLVLVGDLAQDEARAILEESFAGWSGEAPPPEPPPLPAPRPARLLLVDRPGSSQANLTVAQTVALTPRHPDYQAFAVMNHLLGGGSTSRLFLNLRVEKGYTYGAYSHFYSLRRGLLWAAQAETRDEVARASVREMLLEVRRLREDPVPETILEAARRHLGGLFAIRLASMDHTADLLWKLEFDGLDPARELADALDRLRALTPQDILNAAGRYLDPARMVTVAVGDQAALAREFAPLAEASGA